MGEDRINALSNAANGLRYAADRIAALIAAGDKLAGFATHNWAECALTGGEGVNCTCGYTEAAKAWREARGDADKV